MIAYFDTSALISLLVEEPTSARAVRLWDEATRVVSTRLVYPEARSALARARRAGRLSGAQLAKLKRALDTLDPQLAHVEVTASLARRAGELAEEHALRGYDAVHLASAEILADPELVVVSGDRELQRAAAAIGLAVAQLG